MPKRTAPKLKDPTPTWDDIRALIGSLPGVTEGTSYGIPSLKVAGKFFTCIRKGEENLVVTMSRPERAKVMVERPDVYHITDHYKNYDYVLIRLTAVTREELSAILYAAWRTVAPKKVLKAYDGGE